jgi:hypothetical protein
MLKLIKREIQKNLLLLYVIIGGIFVYAMMSPEEDCDNVGNIEYESCVIINDQ